MRGDELIKSERSSLTIQVTFKGNFVPKELRKIRFSKNLSMIKSDEKTDQE